MRPCTGEWPCPRGRHRQGRASHFRRARRGQGDGHSCFRPPALTTLRAVRIFGLRRPLTFFSRSGRSCARHAGISRIPLPASSFSAAAAMPGQCPFVTRRGPAICWCHAGCAAGLTRWHAYRTVSPVRDGGCGGPARARLPRGRDAGRACSPPTARAGSGTRAAGRCPHAGSGVSGGTIEGTTLTCPRHGSRFGLCTGDRLRRSAAPCITARFPGPAAGRNRVSRRRPGPAGRRGGHGRRRSHRYWRDGDLPGPGPSPRHRRGHEPARVRADTWPRVQWA